MDEIEDKIHRFSQTQLHILLLLAKSSKGIASSPNKIRGKTGKALGGVISSLSRQHIQGERLILPWGKENRQLKWKLNTKLIAQDKLFKITEELLSV